MRAALEARGVCPRNRASWLEGWLGGTGRCGSTVCAPIARRVILEASETDTDRMVSDAIEMISICRADADVTLRRVTR
ncbi:MAG: hypothetical protein RBR71_12570 [Gudongella sp.]|nr:hypothetical protein [Gudongella sp.]